MKLTKNIRFLLTAVTACIASIHFSPAALATNPPAINPSGTHFYFKAVQVGMSAEDGAQIYYTLDGSTPTTSSTLYTNAFWLASTTTVKAIAVLAGVPSTVAVANEVIDYNAVCIGSPVLWLRSDFGLTTSGTAVTEWLDCSGFETHATQTTPANRPTIVANALNGYPAVNFNGTSQFMQLPNGFLTNCFGATIFIVTAPASTSATGDIISIGDGTVYKSQGMGQNAGKPNFYVYVGNTLTSITGPNTLSTDYKLLEVLFTDTHYAALYNNGTKIAENSSMAERPVNYTTNNYIGKRTTGADYYSGRVVELLFYNGPVTEYQRAVTEGYLLQKYHLPLQKPTAPILSSGSATFTAPTQVSIAAQNGTTIYYTTNGTTPTTSSPVYTGPLNISYTQTLKAIAVLNNTGKKSNVSSATYTLNPTQWPAPDAGDPTPLQIKLQLPTTSITQ